MQEIENSSREKLDAVNALEAFIEKECRIIIGMGVYVGKEDFAQRYARYCDQLQVEVPSPGILGNVLVGCFRAVWGDTLRVNGQEIAVWRNLAFKDHKGASQ